MFWDSGVSFGCLAAWLMWGLAFGLIAFSMAGMHVGIGQLGLGVSAAAASLTVVRDGAGDRSQRRR